MNLLRNVWADLVEKRLWPVAAGLVVAAVGVPVALGHGSSSPSDTADTPVAAGPAVSGPSGQAIKLVQPGMGHLSSARPHDPFGGPGTKKSAQTSTAGASGASAPKATPVGSGGASAGGSSGGSGPVVPVLPINPIHPVGPGPNTTKPPAPGTPAGYRVDVSWGQAGSTKSDSDIPRLSRLQAEGAPLVLFLGVREDGKTAAFLVVGPAAPSGDGGCLPSGSNCEIIELRQGESEFFDVTGGDAGVVQYELDVDKLALKRASDGAAAATAKARESKPGREALRSAIASGKVGYVGHYQYSKQRGVLIFHTKAHAAAVNTGVPAPIAPTP